MQEKQERLASTIEQARGRLSVGRTLFYDLMKSGEIRTFKIGTRTLVPESELMSFIQRKMKAAA